MQVQAAPEPFLTSSDGEAAYLVHRRHRLTVLIDERRRPVYVFDRSVRLLHDVALYSRGAVACAVDLMKAARIVAKLTKEARHRRHAWEDRIVNGRSVKMMPAVVGPTLGDVGTLTTRGDGGR